MRCYVGVDGGGTKTALCSISEDLKVSRHSVTGGASWREHGIQAVVECLQKAVQELLDEGRHELAGIAIGLPCYGESANGDRELMHGVESAFAPAKVYLTNDVEVGWAGSLALGAGINVVAGTGSIAYGKDIKGNTARSGGWDEFFSDEGSCYWMGRRMMELFSKQSDGRIPRGPLYDIVRQEFSLTDDILFIDHVRAHYLSRRERVASLQILVERAAKEGDQSAIDLYSQAVQELCMLAGAVRNALDFPSTGWEVSFSGGLFKAGELIIPIFKSSLEQKGGRLVSPRCSPEKGALLLAFEQFYPEGLPALKDIL